LGRGCMCGCVQRWLVVGCQVMCGVLMIAVPAEAAARALKVQYSLDGYMQWYIHSQQVCIGRRIGAVLALCVVGATAAAAGHCYVLGLQVSRGCTGVHFGWLAGLVALCVRCSYEACSAYDRQDLRVQGPPSLFLFLLRLTVVSLKCILLTVHPAHTVQQAPQVAFGSQICHRLLLPHNTWLYTVQPCCCLQASSVLSCLHCYVPYIACGFA
jgi:hypothetical protein